ncbi:MAG: TatD family hydrolase [Armatimonadetes bacterium]|nr:TatD family hydrolase [Armatimonadota bacterium]
MLSLVDTHCHLNHPDLAGDICGVLERAAQTGVGRIICAAFDMESSETAVEQACGFGAVYATVGIHPHDASRMLPGDEGRLKSLCREEKVVAVGETGLDYHYDHSPRETQREVFRLHIRLACEVGLPVVIHSREAAEDTLDILEDEGVPPRGAVLHCFSGDDAMARRALELGCFLGIAGPITFRSAASFRETVSRVPLERLLVETDAPYLAPHPHRGKTNEPAYILLVVEALASVLSIPATTAAEVTTANAVRLFKLG